MLTETQNSMILKAQQMDWSVPEFKVKHFVGGSHIHPLHRIQQYLLELNSRMEMMGTYEYELSKFKAQRELEYEKREVAQFKAEKTLCEIEIADIDRKVKATEGRIFSLSQDIKKYMNLIEEFNNSPEGRDADGELYYDILSNPIKREAIEAEYWEYRLAKQAAMDMVAYGRIGTGNMEAILQLSGDSQNKCIAMAYEVLITNETRMNLIQEKVVERLESGRTVSDIGKLMNIQKSEFLNRLESSEKPNVPLIQKR
jgi:hypothetical protein